MNFSKTQSSARFGSTYTKIGTTQRRLAWPLRKDDMQIREAFHIFMVGVINKIFLSWKKKQLDQVWVQKGLTAQEVVT